MLYVTTRTDRDAYTDHWVLTHDRGACGGEFLPMQMPRLDEAALGKLAEQSFDQNIADILNLFYRRQISAWDVELVMGKRPLGILELNSRTLAAEIRPGADISFGEVGQRLWRLLREEDGESPSRWFMLSLRIAVLCAVFGELMARGIVSRETPLDVVVPSCDFQYPMAAWYARAWGLPVGRILCCCNENNAPWTLLHLGQLRTDTALKLTLTAECDQAIPAGLERLILETLGRGEVQRYLACVENRRPYKLDPEQLERLRRGMWVSVVSQRRMQFMLPNIYRAGRWMPDPYSAMCYAGLVDHRSRTGETGTALIISEESPRFSLEMLSRVMGVSEEKLSRQLAGKEEN